jgi:multicomponent Na+:H+ antiporter subunit D
MNSLVPLPVLIPLLGAILLALLNKRSSRWFADLVSIAAVIAGTGVSLVLLRQAMHSPLLYWFGAWTPRSGVAVGINFYVDPLSAGLAAFVTVLATAAFIFSIHYFDSIGNLYHVLMLGFVAAMCGFSLSGDIFNLFVFFELMSVAAFALCGYKTEERGTEQGAINFAVLNTIGGFLSLLGIGMFYSRTGALNLAQIGRALSNQSDVLVITAFVFVICGFLVKAAAFPFHFWLADAHAVAPTPVCVLFSGIMVQLGIYGTARVYWAMADGSFGAHRGALTGVLLVMGVLTAVVGAFMCFAQRHIKRLLAFSTISHTGLLLIAFALLKPEALGGAALYVIGHGAAKGALFLIAGILLHRFGSVDEGQLYGRGSEMPWTGILFALGGLGLAGSIPFATFLGEHSIDSAAEHLGLGWIEIVFFIAAAVTGGAVFRVYARVFLGRGTVPRTSEKQPEEGRETKGPHSRVPAVMFVPACVLIVIAIGAGCIPHSTGSFRTAAFEFTNQARYESRVLDAAALSVISAPAEQLPLTSAILRSTAAIVAAILLAVLSLSPGWRRKPWYHRPVMTAVNSIRYLHSGKVGDYVAYFTFGVAALGIALAMLVAR